MKSWPPNDDITCGGHVHNQEINFYISGLSFIPKPWGQSDHSWGHRLAAKAYEKVY